MKPLPRYLNNSLVSLSKKFQSNDYLVQLQRRTRHFTPTSFLVSMLSLVGSTGRQGYDHMLLKVFGALKAPRKSAFAAYRSMISFRFFQRILTQLIKDFNQHRPEFRGMKIYAIDGWQFNLPRTKDIIANGYSGRKTSKYKESYLPKGFITHCYDVLSETSKDFMLNTTQTELADALSMIDSLEKNSIVLYDRAYFSKALVKAHFHAGNYFIARCQSNANGSVKKLFTDSTKDLSGMYYETDQGKKKIWFIKVHNKHTNSFMLFATNLPRCWRSAKLFDQLYQYRWPAETSFYELSETIKLEQWHSKSYNGILQEIYAGFLLLNLTKILRYFVSGQKANNPTKRVYKKSNLKLLVHHFINFICGPKPQLSKLAYIFHRLLKLSTEKRKRRSRSSPRVVRAPASPYKHIGSEWLWDKKHSLN